MLVETGKPKPAAETYKSKLTFPLTPLPPRIAQLSPNTADSSSCGEDSLSVDFISKPCLLELTQNRASCWTGLTIRSADSNPVSAASAQTEAIEEISITQIKSRATWALDPRPTGLSQTGQLFSVASSPQGVGGRPKFPSFLKTCSAQVPVGGDRGRNGHRPGYFLSTPGTQSPRSAVAADGGRLWFGREA